MPKVQINASAYGTPGEVVAVENGLVVWTGPIEDLGDAGGFDALFCHDDDEKRLMSLFVALTPPGEPGNQDGATSQGITALDQRSMTAPP